MYDYVIVGAGSAGCVLAHRLSEDPHARVLLLEAGGPDTRAEIRIPAAFSKLFQTEADWNYWTAPQRHLGGRRLYWPRGRVLGGSSAINAMIYIRGHRQDYDAWEAGGCTGWGFESVLPYFKRSEDNARGASAYHGTGGPLRIEDPRDPHAVSLAFVRAAEEAGIGRNTDFNGPEQEGVGFYQLTQKGGRRHSAAAAFLRPIRSRRNLTVTTDAHATRVLFEGRRAVGVAYEQAGEALEARAAREVILCGGAINTPQLLMLSGVGPGADLAAHGVSVVADSPGVGQNLQDHLIVGVRTALRQPVSLLLAESAASFVRYLATRRGGLTSNVAEVGLFARTREGEPAPDIQFHVAPTLFYEHGLKPATEHGFSAGPTLVRPRSRGQITLASPDPLAHPHIDPNYLADEADVRALVEGVRLARRIAAQPALEDFRGDELTPGIRMTSDRDLAAYVRETCETLYHPVGTCRMGQDALAVVDPALRVRGVEGLRVVDASVMPTVPNGNTNAPTFMIAEKAADLILGRATPTAEGSASEARGRGDGASGLDVRAKDALHPLR